MDINGKKVRGIYFGNNIIVDGSELPPAPPAVDKTKAPLKSLIGNNSPTHAIVQETFTLTRGWYYVELAGCGGGDGNGVYYSNTYSQPDANNWAARPEYGKGGKGALRTIMLPIFQTTDVTIVVGTPGQDGTMLKAGDGGKGYTDYTDIVAQSNHEALQGTINPSGAELGGAHGGPSVTVNTVWFNSTGSNTIMVYPHFGRMYVPGGGAVGPGGGDGGGPLLIKADFAASIQVGVIDYFVNVGCGGGGGGYGQAAAGSMKDYDSPKTLTNSVGYSGGGGGAVRNKGYAATGGGGGGSTVILVNNDIFVAGGGGGGAGCKTWIYDAELYSRLITLNGRDAHGETHDSKSGWAKIWKLT